MRILRLSPFAQDEVVNYNDTNHLDVNPKISVRGDASQEDLIITIPSMVKTFIVIGSTCIKISLTTSHMKSKTLDLRNVIALTSSQNFPCT